MNEKIIQISEIDQINLFGVNNKTIDLLINDFPKLKIIARGDSIIIRGEESEIELFESKLYDLINSATSNDQESEIIVYSADGYPVKGRTKHQREMVKAVHGNDLLFAIGPAGTGKTYIAIALAIKALKNKEVKRIILTRPAVEAGERLGFLPGDLREKLDPYLQPLYDALMDMLPAKRLEKLMEDGIIQIAPLAYMRGRTLDSAFVILDEAQNTTLGQMKMFLTRMGKNAKFIVTGDATQIDLPRKYDSGLIISTEILKNIKGISIINFSKEDIVRHEIVSKIVQAFDSLD